MTAVYPTAVKSFFYRQDYTEIVEAADVNTAYEEITAVQSILGTNPNTDNIDSATIAYATVRDNIAAVRRGLQDPYLNISSHNFHVPYADNSAYAATWTSVSYDTHKMFKSGTQLICPRSGFYTFDIYARWHLDQFPSNSQQTPLNRSGQLGISTAVVGSTALLVGQQSYFPQGFRESIHMSASITQPWFQGSAVTMNFVNTVMTSGMPCTAIMAITYQRNLPPTSFHAILN